MHNMNYKLLELGVKLFCFPCICAQDCLGRALVLFSTFSTLNKNSDSIDAVQCVTFSSLHATKNVVKMSVGSGTTNMMA